MNNILATGESRIGGTGISLNFNFDNQSTILGENAGKDLKIGSFSSTSTGLQRNFFNTFIGHKAGQNVLTSAENLYLGNEAGINTNGSNNIILGRNKDSGLPEFSYNIVSVGNNNYTGNEGITLGTHNDNGAYENLVIGKLQDVRGINNILSGFRNTVLGYYNISIGNDNKTSNTRGSVVLGNEIRSSGRPSSNYIAIGNGIYVNEIVQSSNYIQIGNDLGSNTFSINIGNTIVRGGSNDTLFLGLSNEGRGINTVIGGSLGGISNMDQFIDDTCNYFGRAYVKGGIYTDRLSLGSFRSNDVSITIAAPSLYSSNIVPMSSNTVIYTLPMPPSSNEGLTVLSTTDTGIMSWIGSVETLIRDSDQIKQGTSNLYYSVNIVDQRVDARVNANFRDKFVENFDANYKQKMLELDLDTIDNGTSNRHITNNVYDRDLFVLGTLTVNKIKVLGGSVNGDGGIDKFFKSMVVNTSNELLDTIFKLTKRIEELEKNA